jgi:hypothetical protein
MDTPMYHRIADLLTAKLHVTTETMEVCRKLLNEIKSGERDYTQDEEDGLGEDLRRCEDEHKKLIEMCYRLLPPFLVNKVRDEVLARHNQLGYCSCPGPKFYIAYN